jgi:hypothetical protein
MALDTVGQYVAQARVLLQDNVAPYRYTDADFIFALNAAMLEARKLRSDLFLNDPGNVPEYTLVGDSVDIPHQYRIAFLYYVTGFVGLREVEPEEEGRAAAFMKLFTMKLTGEG